MIFASYDFGQYWKVVCNFTANYFSTQIWKLELMENLYEQNWSVEHNIIMTFVKVNINTVLGVLIC